MPKRLFFPIAILIVLGAILIAVPLIGGDAATASPDSTAPLNVEQATDDTGGILIPICPPFCDFPLFPTATPTQSIFLPICPPFCGPIFPLDTPTPTPLIMVPICPPLCGPISPLDTPTPTPLIMVPICPPLCGPISPLDTPTPTPTATDSGPVPSHPGDVDCSGSVNAIDSALILQFSAGLVTSLPCPDNADVNGDGAVNAIDATLILQSTAGLLTL